MLNHMQIICTSLQTDNHASTSSLHIFYRPDALPAAQPTASKHWRQATADTCKEIQTPKIRALSSVNLLVHLKDMPFYVSFGRGCTVWVQHTCWESHNWALLAMRWHTLHSSSLYCRVSTDTLQSIYLNLITFLESWQVYGEKIIYLIKVTLSQCIPNVQVPFYTTVWAWLGKAGQWTTYEHSAVFCLLCYIQLTSESDLLICWQHICLTCGYYQAITPKQAQTKYPTSNRIIWCLAVCAVPIFDFFVTLC